jgi:hypothetical protein
MQLESNVLNLFCMYCKYAPRILYLVAASCCIYKYNRIENIFFIDT